jgi:hypothetical protein
MPKPVAGCAVDGVGVQAGILRCLRSILHCRGATRRALAKSSHRDGEEEEQHHPGKDILEREGCRLTGDQSAHLGIGGASDCGQAAEEILRD